MKTSLYLDRRSKAKSGYPLKIYLKHQGKPVYVPTGVFLDSDQWDDKSCAVVRHPKAALLNRQVGRIWSIVDETAKNLAQSGRLITMGRDELKCTLSASLDPDASLKPKEAPRMKEGELAERWHIFASTRRTEGTQRLYERTWAMMMKFDPSLPVLSFDDITRDWMKRFDAWLARDHSLNGRSILYRNIRAVFNDAIDDDLTSNYPFRKFKVKTEETMHRDLQVDELRALMNAPQTPGSLPHEREYIDLFMLSFLLIGINLVDMKGMKISGGRVKYRRAKTHKLYDIKVEPEAMAIIEKYSGGEHLINIFDRFSDYNQLTRQIGRGLRSVGRPTGKQGKVLGKGMFPGISYYWARHTWASIASEIDIPEDIIAHALGHGKKTVTGVYIDFKQRKVDDANRKVIDYVFYGKDWRNQSSTASMLTW